MSHRSPKVFRFTILTVLLTFVIIAIALSIYLAIARSAWWNGGITPIPFETTAWKSANAINNGRTVRSQMIDDLLRRYDFHGWPRQKIRSLLGESDWDPNISGFANWDSAYHLGLERSGAFSLDDECLVFRFDDKDRVIAYAVLVN